jgi:hypothetical protein
MIKLVYHLFTSDSANINSIQKTGLVLIVDDSSYGSVFLKFTTDYDTAQAQSLLNYVLENPNVNIDTLSPVTDSIPVVYFRSKVGGNGDYISMNGLTAGSRHMIPSHGNNFLNKYFTGYHMEQQVK